MHCLSKVAAWRHRPRFRTRTQESSRLQKIEWRYSVGRYVSSSTIPVLTQCLGNTSRDEVNASTTFLCRNSQLCRHFTTGPEGQWAACISPRLPTSLRDLNARNLRDVFNQPANQAEAIFVEFTLNRLVKTSLRRSGKPESPRLIVDDRAMLNRCQQLYFVAPSPFTNCGDGHFMPKLPKGRTRGGSSVAPGPPTRGHVPLYKGRGMTKLPNNSQRATHSPGSCACARCCSG